MEIFIHITCPGNGNMQWHDLVDTHYADSSNVWCKPTNLTLVGISLYCLNNLRYIYICRGVMCMLACPSATYCKLKVMPAHLAGAN